jgi:hypothetical protein
MSVFDLPFLLAEFPGRPSMVVGDVETFHAEFRSFPMLFLRSSITRVGTAYAKVNFSMSMYIVSSLGDVSSFNNRNNRILDIKKTV